MIRITKQGNVAKGKGAVGAHHYRLANNRLIFQQPVKSLAAFSEGPASYSYGEVLARSIDVQILDESNAALEYAGKGQFQNRQQDVACWKQEELRQIDVGNTPVCQINMREGHVHVLNDRPFDDQLNLEVVTGPAMILLMSVDQVYCLHAGAVATPYGNIAFIAESGTGKSTISRHSDDQWCQIADDIVPLQLGAPPMLLPDFPQLKLKNANVVQPQRENVPLNLILRLNNNPVDQPHFRKLPRTEAMLQIVRHTVAAKLFDRAQLKKHARFAKKLSGQVAVVELNYPRQLDKLSALRRSAIDYLQLGDFN